MVKRWINRKEVKELFKVSPARLKKLAQLNLVETKTESGKRGRPSILYNTAQLRNFLKNSEPQRKALLNIVRGVLLSNEENLKAWSAIVEKTADLSYTKPLSIVEEAPEEKVNHPAYYNTGSIEVIDAIDDWGLDFSAGNVVKYVVRAAHKNNQQEDLEKAMWYIQRLLG